MNIFVSYTTRDHEISIDFLEYVSTKFKQIAYVYVDLINNDSFNKQQRVFDELDNSDILILLLSPNVYKSEWVLQEIDRAKQNFIPILSLTLYEIINLDIRTILKKIQKHLLRKYDTIP